MRSRQARNELVVAHLNLVRPIAVKLAHSSAACFDADELEGEGMLALLEAADRYRPETNVPFSAYARTLIRYAMKRAMRRRNWRDLNREPLKTSMVSQLPTPEHSAILNQQTTQLAWARAVLPSREKAVIEAVYFQDRTVKDVAIDIGLARENTVRMHRRALKAMRGCLVRRAA